MFHALKTDLRLYGKDNWIFAVFLSGGFLFGQILLFIVLRVAGEEGWFPMSTLMAAVCGIIATIISDGFGFRNRYMVALSMGQRRKPLLAVQFIESTARSIIILLLVALLARLDVLLCRLLYAASDADEELAAFVFTYVTSKHLLFGALPVAIFSFSIAAIYGKFGKKGGTVLYFAFICLCIGLPRVFDLMERYPKSTAGKILAALGNLPPLVWIAFAAALLIIMLAVSVRILLRIRVELD